MSLIPQCFTLLWHPRRISDVRWPFEGNSAAGIFRFVRQCRILQSFSAAVDFLPILKQPRDIVCSSNLSLDTMSFCTSYSHTTSTSSNSLTESDTFDGFWLPLEFLTFPFKLKMNLMTYVPKRSSPMHLLKVVFISFARFVLVG